MTAKLAHIHRNDQTESLSGWEWHQDCLVVTILIASCFDLKTMKKMLKRAGLADRAAIERPDELLYAMHEACHVNQEIKDAVAKELNTKFRSTVQKVKSLSTQNIQEKADQTPWLVPLIWACYACESLEVRKTGRQFAHSVIWKGMKRLRGASQVAKEKERADGLLKQNAALRKTLSEKQKENKKLSDQIKRLSNMQAAQPARDVTAIAPIKNEVKRLRRELSEKTTLVQDLKHKMSVWRSLALNPEQDERHKAGADEIQAMHLQAPSTLDCERDCGDCLCTPRPDCPLNGKTVAVIGGLNRLEKNYCKVIKQMGGQGVCHTGNVRSGARRLRQLVSKSDMVVYLTPINSHGSLEVVKKQCKRCNTPFCPLNSTSPTMLETHLREMVNFF